MRLICPNCGAQYEVPDDVIPDAGRDVQCSNCGSTWYQHHPDNDPELREEIAAEEGFQEQADVIADPEPAAAVPEVPETPEASDAPARRSLDPSIAEVLREEAEREARARAAEGGVIESQPDLGLGEPEDEGERRARQVRERMARMRGMPDDAPPEPEEVEDDTPLSRRDLLPDIDEINSSLRAASDRRPAAADDHELPGDLREELPTASVTNDGKGFRRGFTLALLLVAILWSAYVMAPKIVETVPALEPLITSYVAVVDQARIALDAQVRNLLIWLDQMTADSGSAAPATDAAPDAAPAASEASEASDS